MTWFQQGCLGAAVLCWALLAAGGLLTLFDGMIEPGYRGAEDTWCCHTERQMAEDLCSLLATHAEVDACLVEAQQRSAWR
jgi:hypothetical protein